MQGRDLVVELVAALVEAAGAVGQHLVQGVLVDLAALPRDVRGDLQQGQCAAHVAIGSRGDFAQRVGGYP